MTLLTTIITGPLEHFFGNFEKEKDRSALGTAPVWMWKCDGVFAYDYAQLHICDYAQLKNFFSQNTHSTAWKYWHLWHILHFVMNPYKKLSIYWLLTFFKRVKCLKANVKLVPLRVQVRPWGGSLRPGGPPARQKRPRRASGPPGPGRRTYTSLLSILL